MDSRVDIVQALGKFGQTIATGTGFREDEILELIRRKSSPLLDMDNMYIALCDETMNTVRFGLAFVDGKRIDVAMGTGGQSDGVGSGRAEEIIHTKRPILHMTRAETEAWYAQPEHKQNAGRTFGSWLGVPMMVGEKVLGVIATYHPAQENAYDETDLVVLQVMANQAAATIDNARLYRDLKRVIDEQTRQLGEAQQKALIAEIGLLTAEMAHHSKNLAGIIRLCAIRLRRGLTNLTAQQQDDLDIIVLNSERILKTAENLLSLFPGKSKPT